LFTGRSDMKSFVSQLGLLAVSCLTIYAVLLAVTWIYVPPHRQEAGLDAGKAFRTLFATEPKYVFLNRSTLDNTKDKLLLLGASNMLVGFRQDQLQQLVPHAEVNNLSVGGSNISQLIQIVDLVHEVQSVEARRHNTFVIGIWHGLFADDSRRWTTVDRHAGDTDIDIERYRYGFFRRTDSGPVAVLPPRLLQMGVYAIHPFLVIDKMVRDFVKSARAMLGVRSQPSLITRGNVQISEAEKLRHLAFWQEYMGDNDVFDQQFGKFDLLVNKIVLAGGRVIVLDLPIPPWHAQRSRYQLEYQERTRQLFSSLSRLPYVAVLPWQSESEDVAFVDEVHPNSKVAERWVHRMASALNNHVNARQSASPSMVTDVSLQKNTDGLTTASTTVPR